MFELMNGKKHYWQWDINQRLVVNNAAIEEVHFCNGVYPYALVCAVYEEEGQRYVNVPNVLLQEHKDIRVFAVCDSCTMAAKNIKVYKRSKPDDYIYTETEVKAYSKLEERIEELENNSITQDEVEEVVSAYLEENTIETGATPEQAAQIEANRAAIEELNNKSDLPEGATAGQYLVADENGNPTWENKKQIICYNNSGKITFSIPNSEVYELGKEALREYDLLYYEDNARYRANNLYYNGDNLYIKYCLTQYHQVAEKVIRVRGSNDNYKASLYNQMSRDVTPVPDPSGTTEEKKYLVAENGAYQLRGADIYTSSMIIVVEYGGALINYENKSMVEIVGQINSKIMLSLPFIALVDENMSKMDSYNCSYVSLAGDNPYIDFTNEAGKIIRMNADNTFNYVAGKGAYELIETITLEEDMAIERTAEPDGTPYNFSRLFIQVEGTAKTQQSTNIWFICGTQRIGGGYFSFIANKTQYGASEVYVRDGYWRSENHSLTTSSSTAYGAQTIGGNYYTLKYSQERYKNITAFKTQGGIISGGIVIKIWGVRA